MFYYSKTYPREILQLCVCVCACVCVCLHAYVRACTYVCKYVRIRRLHVCTLCI